MARPKSTPLRTALSRMFPAALLRRLALQTGMVRRRRLVDPVKLFWVVVLALGSGGERSFADLRRSYEKVTGQRLSASSFYNRFTPAFTRFLRELLAVGLEQLNRCADGTAAVLGEIRDVLWCGFHHRPASRRSGRLLAGMPDQPHLGGGEVAHRPQRPGYGAPAHQDHLGTSP